MSEMNTGALLASRQASCAACLFFIYCCIFYAILDMLYVSYICYVCLVGGGIWLL
nr:hypothetical protein Q903MT_gene413 [Picea sitchensis]